MISGARAAVSAMSVRVSAVMIGIAAVVAAVILAGCSTSSTATIKKSDVEHKMFAALTAKVGTSPKSISCPADLEAKVGASEKCTLTAPDGSTVGVVARVTKVDGGHYLLDFKVDTKVTPAPSS